MFKAEFDELCAYENLFSCVPTSGRVRASNGRVFAIVDEAKYRQHVVNIAKEKWMVEALNAVRGEIPSVI